MIVLDKQFAVNGSSTLVGKWLELCIQIRAALLGVQNKLNVFYFIFAI